MGRWETATFSDVLEIKNGKNQKSVENPNGMYPIYGSGGIMGYSDEYICEKLRLMKLAQIGIDAPFLFPDLDNITRSVKNRYIEELKGVKSVSYTGSISGIAGPSS